MKEKLIELLIECDKKYPVICDMCVSKELIPKICGEIADYLIANGVTVQRWIPVTERLPEVSGKVLCAYNGKSRVLTYWRTSQTFEYSGKPLAVTHWMPLPTPPKDGDT